MKTKKKITTSSTPSFLSNIVFGENQAKLILNILKDGFLRSSKETKHVELFGWPEGSEFIFLQLENPYVHLILDTKALDTKPNTYFNYGWCAGLCKKTRKASVKTPIRLTSEQFSIAQLDKYRSWIKNKSKHRYDINSHEIITPGPIDLKKYLKQVNISPAPINKQSVIDKIKKILKEEYPAVQLKFFKGRKMTVSSSSARSKKP